VIVHTVDVGLFGDFAYKAANHSNTKAAQARHQKWFGMASQLDACKNHRIPFPLTKTDLVWLSCFLHFSLPATLFGTAKLS
jgi:hypothetical protein